MLTFTEEEFEKYQNRIAGEQREARRQHKDIVAQLTPVVEWTRENDAAVRSLQRLLGDLRKVERSTQNRFYTPRTDILKGEQGK